MNNLLSVRGACLAFLAAATLMLGTAPALAAHHRHASAPAVAAVAPIPPDGVNQAIPKDACAPTAYFIWTTGPDKGQYGGCYSVVVKPGVVNGDGVITDANATTNAWWTGTPAHPLPGQLPYQIGIYTGVGPDCTQMLRTDCFNISPRLTQKQWYELGDFHAHCVLETDKISGQFWAIVTQAVEYGVGEGVGSFFSNLITKFFGNGLFSALYTAGPAAGGGAVNAHVAFEMMLHANMGACMAQQINKAILMDPFKSDLLKVYVSPLWMGHVDAPEVDLTADSSSLAVTTTVVGDAGGHPALPADAERIRRDVLTGSDAGGGPPH